MNLIVKMGTVHCQEIARVKKDGQEIRVQKVGILHALTHKQSSSVSLQLCVNLAVKMVGTVHGQEIAHVQRDGKEIRVQKVGIPHALRYKQGSSVSLHSCV